MTTLQKIGVLLPAGSTAYVHQDHLFVKLTSSRRGSPYPDNNNSMEVYSDGKIIELETFGPLYKVTPGESIEHVE